MQALLRAKANTELIDNEGNTALQYAEAQGHKLIAKLIQQHAAPPQPAAASPAAPVDAGEPVVSSPASLPVEIFESARHGELQKVVKWLGKGGPVDTLCPTSSSDGHITALTLLHAAATNDQLEIVRELLKRGASVDLQSSLGGTALMGAAYHGYLSIVLVLLQHSANPDLQDSDSQTALMWAANYGQEACVKALLRAKADTELVDEDGDTALQYAENQGHTATAALIRQHAAPPQPAAASPAASPNAGEPEESSPAPLPEDIFESVQRGETQKVVKWLGNAGSVNTLYSLHSGDRTATFSLLHTAASFDHPELIRELLKRGASVDLPTSLGLTAS